MKILLIGLFIFGSISNFANEISPIAGRIITRDIKRELIMSCQTFDEQNQCVEANLVLTEEMTTGPVTSVINKAPIRIKELKEIMTSLKKKYHQLRKGRRADNLYLSTEVFDLAEKMGSPFVLLLLPPAFILDLPVGAIRLPILAQIDRAKMSRIFNVLLYKNNKLMELSEEEYTSFLLAIKMTESNGEM